MHASRCASAALALRTCRCHLFTCRDSCVGANSAAASHVLRSAFGLVCHYHSALRQRAQRSVHTCRKVWQLPKLDAAGAPGSRRSGASTCAVQARAGVVESGRLALTHREKMVAALTAQQTEAWHPGYVGSFIPRVDVEHASDPEPQARACPRITSSGVLWVTQCCSATSRACSSWPVQ
jgi:hypothetical protein